MSEALRLAKEEGIFCGISAGAASFAAGIIAKRPEFKGKRILFIVPDTGERYLSTPLFEGEINVGPIPFQDVMNKVVNKLSEPSSYEAVYHRSIHHDVHMPSVDELKMAVELLRSVIFPGYFLNAEIRTDTMKYYTGSALDRSFRIFAEQIKRGFCFSCCQADDKDGSHCIIEAEDISRELLSRVPDMREMAASDAEAAYVGDPAAKSVGEAIFCYPSVKALTSHRIAHELYTLGVPVIPRIISESAHSETGIDIHPGATIGRNCFIDHGTGTVIGETCVIGKNVRIYQGVTLGAKSFPLDDKGRPIKGVARHPIVEDDAVIYSGATILGRVTIGKGAEIGGNVWLTRSVEPGAKILQRRFEEKGFENGSGI